MAKSNQLGFSTRCVHAGQEPDPTTGAVMMPIYATSTYVQQSPGVHKGYDYARTKNPDPHGVRALHRRSRRRQRSALPSPRDWPRSPPCSNASITARISSPSTISMAARAGCSSACASARRTRGELSSISPMPARSKPRSARTRASSGSRRRPIRCSSSSISNGVAAIAKRARHLDRRRQHLRQPLCAAAARARLRSRGAFDHQISQRPFRHGRRRARWSATMRSCGERLKFLQNAVGAIQGPFDSFPRAARPQDAGAAHGAPLRARRSRSREWLEAASQGAPRVLSRPAEPSAARARQAADARLRRHDLGRARRRRSTARRFLERCQLFALAESLGGVESLIEHPALMTHGSVPADVRATLGIGDDAGAALGRHRGCRRPDRRSRGGAGLRLRTGFLPI